MAVLILQDIRNFNSSGNLTLTPEISFDKTFERIMSPRCFLWRGTKPDPKLVYRNYNQYEIETEHSE